VHPRPACVVYSDTFLHCPQVFFILGDNSRLDAMGFTVFGKVKTCCDELNTIFNPTPGVSGGVDQGLYEQKVRNVTLLVCARVRVCAGS
jgi:cyclophilin family peptidyl-prolyl cis-trans isomerase